jgi:hypothetical protein
MDWAHVSTELTEHVNADPTKVVILSHGIIKYEEMLETRFIRLCKQNFLDPNEMVVVATFTDGGPDPYRMVGTSTGVRAFTRLMRDETFGWVNDTHRLKKLCAHGCHLEVAFDDEHQILTASIPKHKRSCMEMVGLRAPSPIKEFHDPPFAAVSRTVAALTVTVATIACNSVK